MDPAGRTRAGRVPYSRHAIGQNAGCAASALGPAQKSVVLVGTWYYRLGMAVKKLSVALDDTVAQEVALAADRAGVSVSAWLNHAAENELAIEAGLDAVREWEAEHGELTAKELAAADKLLDRVLHDARRAS